MINPSSIEYINRLSTLKSGDLSIIRTLQNKTLDESLEGFDIFTSLWWPLREKNQRAPRREPAWLIAKLFASCPLKHENGMSLPLLLGKIAYEQRRANDDPICDSLFERIINLPLNMLEPELKKAIMQISRKYESIDWVHLIDTVSIWDREYIREKWILDFINHKTIEE